MFYLSDLEDYARHLGFDGLDADMFYEAYYNLDADEEYDDLDYEYTLEGVWDVK